MFTIQLHKSLHVDETTLSASGTSLESALELAGKLAGSDGVFISDWVKDDDGFVLNVYNWYDACTPNPPPLVRIIAPKGTIPPPI
jgi:hypothetical protein